jgi:AmmeMemoRadiSam system protein A
MMHPDCDRPGLLPLCAAERQALLALARASIAAALRGLEVPRLDDPSPALCECGGAFVSLHLGRQLRGCVGTVVAERPLYENVARMARSAAFDDPRFPPLSAAELQDVRIEVSRLGSLLPVPAEDVQPGVHGVCVQHGAVRAVFLPQVALHHGWDRETLLTELCCKAALAPHAWKQPDVHLLVFLAEVFSETESTPLLN